MKQIYDIIINSNNILFIDEIRIIIYKMHLLDFKPEDILMSYIKLCIQKKIFNNQQLYSVINEAALNELKCNKTNKYFFCLEKFFIFIKSIL